MQETKLFSRFPLLFVLLKNLMARAMFRPTNQALTSAALSLKKVAKILEKYAV